MNFRKRLIIFAVLLGFLTPVFTADAVKKVCSVKRTFRKAYMNGRKALAEVQGACDREWRKNPLSTTCSAPSCSNKEDGKSECVVSLSECKITY